MPHLHEQLEGWGCLWLRSGAVERKSRGSGLTMAGLGHPREAVGVHVSGHQGRWLVHTEICQSVSASLRCHQKPGHSVQSLCHVESPTFSGYNIRTAAAKQGRTPQKRLATCKEEDLAEGTFRKVKTFGWAVIGNASSSRRTEP